MYPIPRIILLHKSCYIYKMCNLSKKKNLCSLKQNILYCLILYSEEPIFYLIKPNRQFISATLSTIKFVFVINSLFFYL